MFEKAKHIDAAFRYTRAFSMLTVCGALIIALVIVIKGMRISERAGERIYILANGKVLEAMAADRKDNIPVEARDHVKMFHQYFFGLDPDDKVIEANMTKALYLADGTAKQQYDNLKEKGYFANVISGNISQTIEADSIILDIGAYPYHFEYRGEEKIVRPTSIVTRSLVTEGFLRSVLRSDNNSHGFLIEKWKIIENKDISIQNR